MKKNIKKSTNLFMGTLCVMALLIVGLIFTVPGAPSSNIQSRSSAVASSGLVDYSGAADGSGSGAQSDPYVVGSFAKLKQFLTDPAVVGTTPADAGAYVVLQNNIDMTGNTWSGAAAYSSEFVFDGNGFALNGLTTNSGLFSVFCGTVKNLTFTNINITGGTYAGVVAATIDGTNLANAVTIYNVNVASGIFNVPYNGSGPYEGGLVGRIINTGDAGGYSVNITNSCVNVDIAGNSVGGLVGYVNTGSCTLNITDCYYSGNLTSTGGYMGGIMGAYSGRSGTTVNVANCYAMGVFNTTGIYCGGIVGYVSSILGSSLGINNCYVSAQLISASVQGAVLGGTSGTDAMAVSIDNCYFNKDIFSKNIAGLVTVPSLSVTNSLGKSVSDMGTLNFVNLLNGGAVSADFIFGANGLPASPCFVAAGIYVFAADMASVPYYETDSGTGSVMLPEFDATGLTLRAGYEFSGWNPADSTGSVTGGMLDAGTVYTNLNADENVIFMAQFTSIDYNIVFDSGTIGTPSVEPSGLSTGTVNVTDSTQSIYSSVWADSYVWTVKLPGTGTDLLDWVQLPAYSGSDRVMLSDLLLGDAGAAFINTYAENIGGTPTFTFKVEDTLDTHIVSLTTNMPEACGGLQISISNGAASMSRDINFGTISLQGGYYITALTAAANPYYTLEGYEIDGGALVTTLPSSLVPGAVNVVFEKNIYTFNVIAALNGQEGAPLDSSLVLLDSSTTNITIGDAAAVAALAQPQDNTGSLRFVAWKIFDNTSATWAYSPKGATAYSQSYDASAVDGNWLARYLNADGQITLVAEYTHAYNVSVNIFDGSDGSSDNGLLISVADGITGLFANYSVLSGVMVPEGSTISIIASAGSLYTFDHFDFGNFAGTASGSQGIIENINAAGVVNAVFVPKLFTIMLQDQNGNSTNAGSVMATVNGVLTSTIKLGDTITSLLWGAISNYEFGSFTLNGVSGTIGNETPVDIPVNEALLAANLNALNNFIITVNLVRIYQLDVSISSGSSGMGSFSVVGSSGVISQDAQGQYWLPINTNITVKASPDAFYTFTGFTGYTASNGVVMNPDGSADLPLTMNTKRSVILTFAPEALTFSANLTTSGGGVITADKTEELTGKTITLIASAPSGTDITSWTINGVNVKNLTNVVLSNNTAAITLTSTWLSTLAVNPDGTLVLNSQVSFSMSSAILMMTIIPCVVIPILIIIFGIYFISLRKKQRVIKSQLIEQQHSQVTLNTGGFINDLREGKNVGQVTNADVKAAIKNNRKKKTIKTERDEDIS